MNTTTQIRFSVVLMFTAMVAIATASTAQDQTTPAQINQVRPAICPVASATCSTQASQQRIALLTVPSAVAQEQVSNWNDSQQAPSSERQVPDVENSTPDEGSIVLAVVVVHTHAIASKDLSSEARKGVLALLH